MAADQIRERKIGRLALDVPQRDVDGGDGVREHAARSEVAIERAQLADHRFDAQRIHPDHECRELFHHAGQRRDYRSAVKAAVVSQAYALDAVIGAKRERHDIARSPVRDGAAGERLDSGQADGLDFGVGDFHCVLVGLNSEPRMYQIRGYLRSPLHGPVRSLHAIMPP
jgi:hypothetical protein